MNDSIIRNIQSIVKHYSNFLLNIDKVTEIFLDVKNPKLFKKVRRYYEGLQLINLSGEDPDADYNAVIECIRQDLNL